MMLDDVFVDTSAWVDLADKGDWITKRCEIRKAFFFDNILQSQVSQMTLEV
jgi:predicted nucleic acid-binding protein